MTIALRIRYTYQVYEYKPYESGGYVPRDHAVDVTFDAVPAIFCPGCGQNTVWEVGGDCPDEDNAGGYFLCSSCGADWFMYYPLSYRKEFAAAAVAALKETETP